MTVGGDDGRSQVVVHLSLAPFVDETGRPLTGEPPGEDRVERRLQAPLDSLRNLVKGRGGKEEPGAELAQPG